MHFKRTWFKWKRRWCYIRRVELKMLLQRYVVINTFFAGRLRIHIIVKRPWRIKNKKYKQGLINDENLLYCYVYGFDKCEFTLHCNITSSIVLLFQHCRFNLSVFKTLHFTMKLFVTLDLLCTLASLSCDLRGIPRGLHGSIQALRLV